MLDEVIARAVARGEIRAGQVSDRVARLPVDLFRHELMMTLQPVADEVIEEIVDMFSCRWSGWVPLRRRDRTPT